MGSWGARSFDNDTAMDWLHKLHSSDDFTLVRKILIRIQGPPEQFTQSCIEQEALAAAEIVASWLGYPPSGKKGIEEWVRAHSNWFTTEILALARLIVASIKAESELRDLQKNRDGVVRAEWLDSVADLENRLQNGER